MTESIDFKREYALSEGNFFSVYRPYFSMLKGEASSQLLAMLFAELINVGAMDWRNDSRRHEQNGGWFICSAKRLMRTFCTSEKTQGVWIRRLVKIGLIETKQKGIPAKRWIRINFELRNELLAKADAVPFEVPETENEQGSNEHDDYGTGGSKSNGTGGSKSNGTGGSKSNGTIIKEEDIKEEDIKEKDVATPAESATSCVGGEPTSSKTKPTPFDHKACEHLVQTLKLAGVNPGRKDASKWLHQFRLLRTYDGASESDIRLVLKWYRLYYPANKGTQYTIVAHSARAFREKFFDKLLPKAQAANKINTNTVNGIRPITIYDVEQAHRKDSDWGSTYLFIDYQEWDLAAYHRDKRSCYQLMAELVNDQRHDRPELVKTCLKQVGLNGAIVDED